jgi:hypothetical protein
MKRHYAHEIENRLDIRFFDFPDEYRDEEQLREDYARDDKLFLAKLYMDSYQILNYYEFNALQIMLIVQTCWDSSSDPPRMYQSGPDFATYDEAPLNLAIVAQVAGVNQAKLAGLLLSAFTKLPILASLFPKAMINEIKEKAPGECKLVVINPPETYSLDHLHKLGQEMKQGLVRRADGTIEARLPTDEEEKENG